MFCFVIRRKLPLYVSDDLQPHIKTRVARHLHSCRRCRLELNRQQTFRNQLDLIAEPPPPEALEQFAEGVLARVTHVPSLSPAGVLKNPLQPTPVFSLQRVALAGMLVFFLVCAMVRYTWVDELLTSYELKRSIVTNDGLIVSDARLHGHDADVKVIKDSADIVIVWLKTSPARSDQARRG